MKINNEGRTRSREQLCCCFLLRRVICIPKCLSLHTFSSSTCPPPPAPRVLALALLPRPRHAIGGEEVNEKGQLPINSSADNNVVNASERLSWQTIGSILIRNRMSTSVCFLFFFLKHPGPLQVRFWRRRQLLGKRRVAGCVCTRAPHSLSPQVGLKRKMHVGAYIRGNVSRISMK